MLPVYLVSFSFQSFESIRKGKNIHQKQTDVRPIAGPAASKSSKLFIFETKHTDQIPFNYGFEIEQKMLSCCLKPQNVFKLGHSSTSLHAFQHSERQSSSMQESRTFEESQQFQCIQAGQLGKGQRYIVRHPGVSILPEN